MGMGGCYAVLKYLVFLVNLIFWISGLTIIVISVWMLSDPAFYVSMAQETSDYYSGVYLLLVVGILMFIVGFLGCCGVIRESQCMLVLFFCFLLIILVAEISAAAWAYSNRNDLEELIKDNVAKTVLDEYSVIQSRTDTFDTFQQELKCCGAKRPTDWFNSKFNNAQKQQVSLAISSPTQGYEVPRSCCKDITNEVECDKIRKIGIIAVIPDGIFSQGCNDLLIEKLEENVFGVVVFGVCVAFCQILGLICALVLCCGIQQRDRYKA